MLGGLKLLAEIPTSNFAKSAKLGWDPSRVSFALAPFFAPRRGFLAERSSLGQRLVVKLMTRVTFHAPSWFCQRWMNLASPAEPGSSCPG